MIGKLVVVVLRHLNQKKANQFCKKFYGQDTSTRGKRYRRVGLLDGVSHTKLTRGVVIISKKDADEVIKFLKNFGVEFHVRDVTLTPEDRRAIR